MSVSIYPQPQPLAEVLVWDTCSSQFTQVSEVSSGYPDGDVVLESPIEIEPFSSIEYGLEALTRNSCQLSIVCSSTLRKTP